MNKIYYKKYLKYKTKYLTLKNQIGGARPSVLSLKDINLFPDKSDIAKYLDPTYGFLWANCNLINNYFHFSSGQIGRMIRRIFKTIPGQYNVEPTKDIFSKEKENFVNNCTPRNIGRCLASFYLCYVMKKKLPNEDAIKTIVDPFKLRYKLFIEAEPKDEKIYHILLALLWWIANNKEGIRQYYIGLNEILPPNLQVKIPDTFSATQF